MNIYLVLLSEKQGICPALNITNNEIEPNLNSALKYFTSFQSWQVIGKTTQIFSPTYQY